MSGTRFLKPALIALGLLPVAACVSLLPESVPVSVYRLSSPEPREWSGNSENWTIIEIEMPQAPRGLSGDQIALVRDGQSLAYIHGARWIAPAPGLLQSLVIDTFNAEQARLAPARPEDGVRADYELHLDLRQFEADYDHGDSAAPTVRVRIAARLVAEHGRRFVGARVFSAERRASENRTGAIVDAFDAAAISISRDIAGWTAMATDGQHSEAGGE
ncbi:MAG: ABC-type transport auxiliary lipoprotein family protein [Pseudomonadota bacterium]|jgi:cholesterol transport system auxiliary component|nr:ABC-type transport auxiliary lipoprotein family protein [Pseudomonadota bacterium]